MVEEMAYKAPELRDRMQYPNSRNSLYHLYTHWVQVRMCALLSVSSSSTMD